MAAARFIERLNEQIGNEFAAQQQYIANAVYYDSQTLPRLAAFFYAQGVEERNHAMMMVGYLLDSDAHVHIPGVRAPHDVIASRGRRALERYTDVHRGLPGPRAVPARGPGPDRAVAGGRGALGG